jgi:hypothetical protein
MEREPLIGIIKQPAENMGAEQARARRPTTCVTIMHPATTHTHREFVALHYTPRVLHTDGLDWMEWDEMGSDEVRWNGMEWNGMDATQPHMWNGIHCRILFIRDFATQPNNEQHVVARLGLIACVFACLV